VTQAQPTELLVILGGTVVHLMKFKLEYIIH
jgi:hypothetical protein